MIFDLQTPPFIGRLTIGLIVGGNTTTAIALFIVRLLTLIVGLGIITASASMTIS